MMGNTTQSQPADAPEYPLWKPTDWTPQQRMLAICGLLLLTLAFALFCGALLVWSAWIGVLNSAIPLAACLLCLGTTLLGAAYWYAFLHARNRFGVDGGNTGVVAYILLGGESLFGLLPLLGPLLSLFLEPPIPFPDWTSFNEFTCIAATGLGSLFSVALSLGRGAYPQHPLRDTAAPESTLGAAVTGARLVLRWAVTVLARNGWLLIGAPLVVFVNLEHHAGGANGPLLIAHSSAQAFALVSGLAAAFFLLAALSELTHRA